MATTDLTTRLLAEIERRDRAASIDYNAGLPVRDVLLYLAALEQIMERHSERGGDCSECGDMTVLWPCATITAIATALDVTP